MNGGNSVIVCEFETIRDFNKSCVESLFNPELEDREIVILMSGKAESCVDIVET